MLSEAAAGTEAAAALDRNDPNYDSEDDAARAAADALAAAAATDDEGAAPAAVPGSSPIVQAVNKLKEDVRTHAIPSRLLRLLLLPLPRRSRAALRKCGLLSL